MKLSSVLSTVGLLCVALVSASDLPAPPENRTFEAPRDKDGRRKIKTGAQFGKSGARIDVCPSGDCANGQMISLGVSRVEEFKQDGTKVVTADTTNKGANAWQAIETMTLNGVSAAVTSFAGDIVVNAKTAKFNLTTVIFESTSWAMNGAQNLTVPAGALKFSVTIANWPFADGATDNYLQFAVTLNAKSKNATALGPPKHHKGNATFARDMVDMGEGMYMDAPTKAVIDGVDTTISAEVVTKGDKVEYVWKFPQFKTGIYYDPVVGTTDASATATDTPTPSGASMAIAASALMAGAAAISFALF